MPNQRLKQKTLVIVGMILSFGIILVLTYTAYKIVFYLEAERTGIVLSKGLASEVFLNLDDFFTPEYFSDKNLQFEKFDYFPKNLIQKLDPDTLKGTILCDAKTDIHTFFRYSAAVTCHIRNQELHYFFDKNFSHPLVLVFILSLILPAVYGAYLFFVYVDRLQNQNMEKAIELTKEKLIIEIGAHLVHDLKKGVMSQLNHLHQDYGQDLDMALLEPDFADRFESKLNEHFQHVDFLNRYINLLTTNFKREKEAHWVFADASKIRQYLSSIFQVKQFNEIASINQPADMTFIYQASNPVAAIFVSAGFSGFQVPEMSFYRILQNISENFNTYGRGDFRLNIHIDKTKKQIFLEAINPTDPSANYKSESTNLGHTIIKQLLQDNFGIASSLKIIKEPTRFCLEISFPYICDKESHES